MAKRLRFSARSAYGCDAFLLSVLFSLAAPRLVCAQTTASPPLLPGGAATGAPATPNEAPTFSAAPQPPADAPAASPALPAPAATAAGPTLTLADVVRLALGNNTGITAARLRLEKAKELIAQVNGQDRPQFRIDAGNLYSSYDTTAPSLPTVWIVNPTLPSGGIIPPVVDAAGNFSSAFLAGTGSGGGGYGAGAISLTPGTLTTNSTNGSPAAENGSSAPANGGASTAATGAGVEAGAASQGKPTQQSPPQTAAPNSLPLGMSVPATNAAPSSDGSGSQGTDAAPAKSSSRVLNLSPALALAALPLAGDFMNGDDGGGSGGNADPADDTVRPAAAAQPADVPARGPGSSYEPVEDATGASSSASQTDYKRDDYAARLSVIQLIDVFGVIPSARDAERDIRDFYALDVDRLKNETALAAKNIYFNALFAQENLATQQEQVTFAIDNVRIAKSRFTHGIVSRFDVLTAQTAMATAQQRFISAQNQQNLAQADLAYLLGTNPGQPINIVAPTLPPLNAVVDVPQTTKIALADRPEILQAEKNVGEAAQLVKVAGSSQLPVVGLIVTAENTATNSTTLPDSGATVGAIVDFPFDDGGVTRSRVRSAKLDVKSQELALEQLQFAVGLEVQQADYNIVNAQAQVSAAQTAVARSEEALNIARERYTDGLGTFLDILNALSELAGSRTNFSTAQYLYQVSLAQLVRAMGGR